METYLRRIDVCIKVLLNCCVLAGVAAMAGGIDWAWVSVTVSATSALLATAVLPALGWDRIVPRIHGFRGRWIDLSHLAKSMWEDLEENGKAPTKKAIGALNASIADLDKESTWFNDNKKFKDEVEKEMEVTLSS